MIPLMTRRSSTLGLPRVSLGRCGLSRANCSSLSQKESRSINGLPSETLNHDAPRFGNQFMGPEPSVPQAIDALSSLKSIYYIKTSQDVSAETLTSTYKPTILK